MEDQPRDAEPACARRAFLAGGLAALAAAFVPSPLQAALRGVPERRIHLYNTHTGESLKTVYWAEGRYRASALGQAARLLRDHRSGEIRAIDPRLLDVVSEIQRRLEGKGAVHVISGYRSPATNAMLAATGDGVARRSLHIHGKAIDIRLPGHSISRVGRAAASLRAGGVGLYPASGFVHIDTGRVRRW